MIVDYGINIVSIVIQEASPNHEVVTLAAMNAETCYTQLNIYIPSDHCFMTKNVLE